MQKNRTRTWNIFWLIVLIVVLVGAWRLGIVDLFRSRTFFSTDHAVTEQGKQERDDIELPASPLVAAARQQIGVVNRYDTGYYDGGYPPEDRGACTDVIDRALGVVGYNLKDQLDADMRSYPDRYARDYDPNINFRRVVNVEVFLDHHAESLSIETPRNGDWSEWQPGDIVTFDQIPGSLWHIAIVSDTAAPDGTPLLIHNYGFGTVEDDSLLSWPTEITGHYRLDVGVSI